MWSCLPPQVNPESKQVRSTMENSAFRSFLDSLSHFPKQSFKCSLPKTNKQAKTLPKTCYFNSRDTLGKLKQWHFTVILYEIFRDRIRSNELKPQKSGEGKGRASPLWLLNMGTGLQREVKESFSALLSYNSPKAHNALCWWDELHDISSLVQSKGSNLHLKPVLSSVGHKNCRTEAQQTCLFIQHQLGCLCSLLFSFTPPPRLGGHFEKGALNSKVTKTTGRRTIQDQNPLRLSVLLTITGPRGAPLIPLFHLKIKPDSLCRPRGGS